MLKVDSFLGCFSLRTGALIIGVLGIVVQLQPLLHNFIELYRDGFSGEEIELQIVDGVVVAKWIFLVVVILDNLIGLILNVVLIVGVLKERPKYLLVSLILISIHFGLTIIVAFDMKISDFQKIARRPFDYLPVFVVLLIAVYFMICVYSYYVEIKKRQKEKRDTVVSVALPMTV